MSARTEHVCAEHALTEQLAHDQTTPADRHHAEQHLEQCVTCRTRFAQLTEDRFPTLHGYTILTELGRGGFGVVYKAIHHDKQRIEALKVLFGKTPVREAYFENEVHLVAKLRHPNIATLYEAHLEAPPLYYTMEFVEGQQLDDYFGARDASLEERIRIIQTVAASVGYAHGEGVVHRDLKPQNIIIDAHGQPRIVDFGIAKKLGLHQDDAAATEPAAQHPERMVGTYGYIAPEQIAGQSIDARADVYGLGVLLFHAITGQPARMAHDAHRLRQSLRERQVTRADDLAAIIARSVHPEPERRYAACADLVTDLENYLIGRPIQARADASVAYWAERMAAVVLRHHPRAIQVAVTVAVAALVTWLLRGTCARWFVPPTGTTQTALIAVTPDSFAALAAGRLTADVPGFRADDPKSRRLVFGRLMERLATAEPRVVVWDYFFPECQPEYDAGFIRGAATLRAPVVLGSKQFDVNGEPDLCPALRQAVHSWGTLLVVQADMLSDEVVVPLAVKRGFNPPIPSLALAAYAAARFPDSDVEIHMQSPSLELRYRKRSVAAGESRWRQRDTESIPIVAASASANHSYLGPEDEPALGRVRFAELPSWIRHTISLEDVLAADTPRLLEWFQGRAVVIGQMLPGVDAHPRKTGGTVFGCQVQAMILDALLRQARVHVFAPFGLATRVCLWCLVGSLLVLLLPLPARWSLRPVTAAAAALFVVGLGLGAYLSLRVVSVRGVEATIAVCALFTIAGPMLLVRALHQRQLRLAPGPVWSTGGTSAGTTLRVPTPADSGSSRPPGSSDWPRES